VRSHTCKLAHNVGFLSLSFSLKASAFLDDDSSMETDAPAPAAFADLAALAVLAAAAPAEPASAASSTPAAMPRPKRRASASHRSDSDFYYGDELDGALDVDPEEEEADAELLQDNEDDDGCVSSLFDGVGDDEPAPSAAARAAAADAGGDRDDGSNDDDDDDDPAAAAAAAQPPAVGAYDTLKIDALKRECTLCAVCELCRSRCAACSAHLASRSPTRARPGRRQGVAYRASGAVR
jgi:hypothetical protein